ncbi:ras-related and estrogen-regulated growth inhibitor-like isoform X3 [Physella acuta]|uniref:ras-related and estrogen-regulated growth inhibitor-like isoform X3 n=1 Tax=Physella acuta TaxID=109671 RepID=UPI0027DB9F73|nr:ras-related and estrogen-regulated growth inhibitor-like isoform X3 [Physella acuta]
MCPMERVIVQYKGIHMVIMSSPVSSAESASSNSGSTLKPYLRRKKSSLGETKIAILGMAGVGKSENKYKCVIMLEGESVTFELLDTRSNDEDMGAREDVVRWSDGFVLVYSVTSRQTFEVLSEVRRKLEDMKKVSHVPVILVGNKADLAHIRQVSQDEGARLAADLCCSFMEVSASEDVTKVTDAFHILCREIIEYKRRSRTFLDRVFGLKKS